MIIIHNVHIHCIVRCPEVNGQDMKLTTQSPRSANVKNECNCTYTISVCVLDVDGENFTLNFFTLALKAGVCMEISLVVCEVNICCFKFVVQKDGSDTVFFFAFATLFSSLLGSQSGCGQCCCEKGPYEF